MTPRMDIGTPWGFTLTVPPIFYWGCGGIFWGYWSDEDGVSIGSRYQRYRTVAAADARWKPEGYPRPAGFYIRHLGWIKDIEGQTIYDPGNRQWDIPQLRALRRSIPKENKVFEEFRVEHDFPDLGQRIMLLNAWRIDDGTGNTQNLLLGWKISPIAPDWRRSLRVKRGGRKATGDQSSASRRKKGEPSSP